MQLKATEDLPLAVGNCDKETFFSLCKLRWKTVESIMEDC